MSSAVGPASAVNITGSHPEFDATIPIVDMNKCDGLSRADFLAEVKRAASEVGFFAVINCGVDREVLDAGYASMQQFFALPEQDKMACHVPSYNAQRGFMPSEAAKGNGVKDPKEYCHIGRKYSEEQLKSLGLPPNVWPEGMDFETPMMNLLSALDGLANPLAEAFAEILSMPKEYLSSQTKTGDCILRALFYPKGNPKETTLAETHTDIDLFTILPRATKRGLQVKNKEGEWVSVVVPEGAIIVNVGDYLESISNGTMRSCEHRVIEVGGGEDRYTVVYFNHLPRAASTTPLKHLGAAQYPTSTAGEMLFERLADMGVASKELLKVVADSGYLERKIEMGLGSLDACKAVVKAGYGSETVKKFVEKEGRA